MWSESLEDANDDDPELISDLELDLDLDLLPSDALLSVEDRSTVDGIDAGDGGGTTSMEDPLVSLLESSRLMVSSVLPWGVGGRVVEWSAQCANTC